MRVRFVEEGGPIPAGEVGANRKTRSGRQPVLF